MTKPILFTTPMLQAILNGKKSQTRRVMKPQPSEEWNPHNYGAVHKKIDGVPDVNKPIGWGPTNADGLEAYKSPYGKPGDKLYIKENFRITHIVEPPIVLVRYDDGGFIKCRLTDAEWQKYENWKQPHAKKSKLFMFKSLARIQLEVTDIRVERVQDISETDALAEGIDVPFPMAELGKEVREFGWHPKGAFKKLWNAINADRGYDWNNNPWVWVIEFKSI